MTFDTVLFDLDDTIHDRDKTLCSFFNLLGFRFFNMLSPDRISVLRRSFIKADNKGYAPREEVFRALLAEVPGENKPGINELIDFWNIEFPKCAQPMPRVYDVLEYFMDKGIKMGIVTNGSSDFQQTKIDKLRLRKYMKTIMISGEAGVEKPDPEIFRIALSEINSSNKTTLFVGDHPVNDIKGSSDAGLKSVWLSNGRVWNIKGCAPQYNINDISYLIELSNSIINNDLYYKTEQ